MSDRSFYLELLTDEKYHELHDVLEQHWKKASDYIHKKELQGLIQLIVALHHLQNDNQRGCEILLVKAAEKLGRRFEDIAEVKAYLETRLEDLEREYLI
ncbi:MAG: DUF309 domain-containing protein [Candidatus Caenarcaniphilales bacterium]|nr:DUF309 domain-containing protein [Candidatus Caenarcaniphilales bacterium]